MTKKEYIRWAIMGDHGLYVDQRLTRLEAIAKHVGDLYGVSSYVSRKLDEDQLAAWRKCKANGDRAVKVSISLVGG